jgi:hypothetical protein
MFLHGPTQLHRWLHHASRHPILEGFRGSGVFMACTGIFVAVYYGMWSAERGSFTPRAAMMAQATLDRGHP